MLTEKEFGAITSIFAFISKSGLFPAVWTGVALVRKAGRFKLGINYAITALHCLTVLTLVMGMPALLRRESPVHLIGNTMTLLITLGNAVNKLIILRTEFVPFMNELLFIDQKFGKQVHSVARLAGYYKQTLETHVRNRTLR